jgi:hypothetical protein
LLLLLARELLGLLLLDDGHELRARAQRRQAPRDGLGGGVGAGGGVAVAVVLRRRQLVDPQPQRQSPAVGHELHHLELHHPDAVARGRHARRLPDALALDDKRSRRQGAAPARDDGRRLVRGEGRARGGCCGGGGCGRGCCCCGGGGGRSGSGARGRGQRRGGGSGPSGRRRRRRLLHGVAAANAAVGRRGRAHGGSVVLVGARCPWGKARGRFLWVGF